MNINDVNAGNFLMNNETRLTGIQGTNRQNTARTQQQEQNQTTPTLTRQTVNQEETAGDLVNINLPVTERQNTQQANNIMQAAEANNNTIPTGPRQDNQNTQPVTENPVPAQEEFIRTTPTINQGNENTREPAANNEQTVQTERLQRQLYEQQTTNGENRNRAIDLLA